MTKAHDENPETPFDPKPIDSEALRALEDAVSHSSTKDHTVTAFSVPITFGVVMALFVMAVLTLYVLSAFSIVTFGHC
jgi:hypothetical protein